MSRPQGEGREAILSLRVMSEARVWRIATWTAADLDPLDADAVRREAARYIEETRPAGYALESLTARPARVN